MGRVLLTILVVGLILGAVLYGCGTEPGQREYGQAMREFEEGNFVRSKALLENSINKRPGSEENAWAYNYLGICCWQLGQLESAIDAFEESRRLNPDLLEPTYNLGVFMYKNGDLFRAAALLEEAALVDLNDPRPLEFLGYIHSKNGDWAKARRALYEALGRASHSSRVLTSLALVELHMEGAPAAIEYLMKALENDPAYGPALYNLANIYEDEMGEHDQAVAYYKQFLEVEPEGPRADMARQIAGVEVPVVAEAKPEVVEVREPVVVKPPKRETSAKRKSPKKVTPSEPEPDVVREPVVVGKPERKEPEKPRTIEELLNAAREATSNGKASLALNLYFQAAGEAHKQDKTDVREAALKEAVKEHFDQPRAHFAYGVFLVEQDEAAAALSSFKQAAVLKDDWAEAQIAVAETAIVIGEYDSALVAFRKAVKLQPDNADVVWSLARLYEEKLDFDMQAMRVYEEFARRFPEDQRALEARKKLTKPKPKPEPEAKPAAKPKREQKRPVEVITVADRKKELKEAAKKQRVARQLPARQLKLKKPRVRNTRAAIQAYNRGTIYQSREDWDRAIYYYRRSLQNDDTFGQAFFNLGVVYRMNSDLDLAKDAYLRAIELEFDLINSRYNLALLYYELKQFTAAEEQAKAVLRINPDHAYAHYILGLIYARSDKTTGFARQHYEQFVKLSPNDPNADSIKKWLKTH